MTDSPVPPALPPADPTPAAAPVLICRCGAPMVGEPKGSQPWNCEKGHRFRVTTGRNPTSAVALRGDSAVGVEMSRHYVWRPIHGDSRWKPSPR